MTSNNLWEPEIVSSGGIFAHSKYWIWRFSYFTQHGEIWHARLQNLWFALQ